MSSFTFAPALGWPVGIILAAVMVAFAIAAIVVHARRRTTSDETLVACVRRVLICVVLAICALTPAIATPTVSRAISATDVVIATDITGSMGVHDAQYGSSQTVSRLEAAQSAIADITKLYPNSSFAAVSFGATGTLDLPLTPDTRAVDQWARSLHTESTSSSSGSSMDAALDRLLVTLKSIHDEHPDDRLLLYVITDGEQTTPTTRRTFSSLRQFVDDACVIGVGSDEGGTIPQSQPAADGEWVIDPSTGEPGISKLDRTQIDNLADELSGKAVFLDANTTAADSQIAAQSNQWRVEETQRAHTRITPLVWPFSIALVALLAWEAAAWLATSRRML
ncbi:VWA domain-containing protein [Bifidobacterium gallicum]|nr:vWA domain-containing protein [Bifidobacterium gallicum]KFI58929.1 von Willebrand factor A [Bifidobacterium gallicum DSM 20093 = LMG 11596]